MSTEISVNGQFPDIKSREKWLLSLNQDPKRTEKQNNADSIPISFLETELDEVYLGNWKIDNFQHQVIANEIVGSLELHVFDPHMKVWITRIGAGAVQIRMNSGAAITDISQKIKTALQMDFPKLKSMCLKNAAKTLGKRFGRDLNRKFEDDYDPQYTPEIELSEFQDLYGQRLSECKNTDEMKALHASLPDNYRNNAMVMKLFTSHKLKLNVG